jgi:hypothetical protein
MIDLTKFEGHTEGPWMAGAYEGGWDCVRESGTHIVCKLTLNNPTNAQLIAAAPDLLRELREARALLERAKELLRIGIGDQRHLDPRQSPWTFDVRVFLAGSEGEPNRYANINPNPDPTGALLSEPPPSKVRFEREGEHSVGVLGEMDPDSYLRDAEKPRETSKCVICGQPAEPGILHCTECQFSASGAYG